MARKIILQPNISLPKESAITISAINEKYPNFIQGEILINKHNGDEMIITLNSNNEVITFPTSLQIAREFANLSAGCKSYVNERIKFLVSGASETFDTLKEIEEWIKSDSSVTINILSSITQLNNKLEDYQSASTETSDSILRALRGYATSADTHNAIGAATARLANYATSADTYNAIEQSVASAKSYTDAARTAASGDAVAAAEQSVASAKSYTDAARTAASGDAVAAAEQSVASAKSYIDVLIISAITGVIAFSGAVSAFSASVTNNYATSADTHNAIKNCENKTTEDIIVIGNAIGSLLEGETISSGTDFTTILKKMLTKELQPQATAPYIDGEWSIKNLPSHLEVGAVLDNINITPQYHDGTFTVSNSTESAGCNFVKYVVTYPNASDSSAKLTDVFESGSWSSNSIVRYGDNTWSLCANYEASTVIPKTNLGNDSSVSIPSGITLSKSKKIIGCYNYFFGTYDETNSGAIQTMAISATNESSGIMLLKKGLIQENTNKEYTIISSSYTPSRYCIFLAIPHCYAISEAIGSLNSEWKLADNNVTMVYTKENTSTDYDVYYYAGTAEQEITLLKIKLQ